MNCTDGQAVREVIAGYEAAWNQHDMTALAALFRAGAEWINGVGMYWRGKDSVVKGHAVYHDANFKNCEIHSTELSVRSLSADIAIAVWTSIQGAYMTLGGDLFPEARTRLTLVLTRQHGEWLISHGHNVRVNVNAAPFDPVNSMQ